MALYQNDDLEYIVDEYFDVGEFDDNDGGDYELSLDSPRGQGSAQDPDDSSDDDDDDEDDSYGLDLSKQKTDTSAADARNGKDIQGIPWERMNYTRDKYRETRLKQYKNYVSLSYSHADLERECKKVEKGSSFFHFQFNTRLVKSTIVHFQETDSHLTCSDS